MERTPEQTPATAPDRASEAASGGASDAVVDHLVYAVASLEEGIAELAERTGVAPAAGGRHPGLGTHNALLSLGPRTYLELIAPDPDQAVPGDRLPFGIGRLAGPSLRAWAAAPGDIEAAVRAGRAAGVGYGDVVAHHRQKTNGEEVHWRMATRADELDGLDVIPFLIDWGPSTHPALDAPSGVRLETLRIYAPDAERTAATLRAIGLAGAVAEAVTPALEAVLRAATGAEVVLRS